MELIVKWLKFVLLFSSCTLGLGNFCNNGWYFYNNSCFMFAQHLRDYEMAENYCHLAGGALAHVGDHLKVLNPIMNVEQKEFWVDHFNMTLTFPLQSRTCFYAKDTSIEEEFCSVEKNFMCEMPKRTLPCPAGFDSFKSPMCLLTSSDTATYDNATEYCASQQGKLAVLDTPEKELDAKSAIIGKNRTFLIGAKKNLDVYKWSTGEIFNLGSSFLSEDDHPGISPDQVSKFDCVKIFSTVQNPAIFSSDLHVNCDEESYFLCETEPLLITTEAPTTTVAPLHCPHGRNWKMHEATGYCFWETTYESERLNWFQARDFCKHYGGDLASYANEEEEMTGLGGARGHYKGLWIGLKRDENNVFHWTDDTTVNFTNWKIYEPNLSSTTKFCVTHSSGTSKWQLDYCGVRRWFVCKSRPVEDPVVVEVVPEKQKRCDIQSYSTFRREWFLYEDHCYLVHESKNTWDTARTFCQDNGAHLASIHSFNETNFILNVMSIFPDSNFWIGLSAFGLHSSYSWSDGTPLDFIYWTDNKTEPDGLSSCISFNKLDGSWDHEHCNRLQSVICKRGVNATYDFTTVEPTAILPGNCETGWYNLGNKCYKYFGSQWSQRESWNKAKEECENIGAALVSIHNQAEQDMLTDIALDASADLWIGLQSKESGKLFNWADDSRMDYTNWNYGEPEYIVDHDLYVMLRSTDELCVIMEYSSVGKWNDISCSEKKGYICEKKKDPRITEPHQDPFLCPNISGWYKLASFCYGLFEQHELTWLEAQAECRKYSANLVTFKNEAVTTFLQRKLTKKDTYFWIGLREKMQDKYEYITGKPMFYTNWISGQPRAASSLLENCGTMNSDGHWVVRNCKEKHPYICRMDINDLQTDLEIDTFSQTCENVRGDWYDLGGDSCYMMTLDVLIPWGEAMHYCFRHGGFLGSFHSTEDINRFLKQTKYLWNADDRSYYAHIGLGRVKDGSFGWVDGTGFDFTNWDEDQPSDDLSLQCVKISLITGKWRVIDCDNYLGFVCSVPKGKTSGEVSNKNTALEKDSEYISYKLTVGGIFGIIICLLVIITVAGILIYYLWPTKEVTPRLLEPEL